MHHLPDISFALLILPFNWRVGWKREETKFGCQFGPIFLGCNWFPDSAEREEERSPDDPSQKDTN